MKKIISKRRIASVIKLHVLEQLRSYQLLITNIILPILFFGVSFFLKSESDLSRAELSILINSQFFSTALMFGVVTYGFTFPLINLVDVREKQTLRWIKQTNLSADEYTIGNKLANLAFLNIHSLLVIALFSILGYLNMGIIVGVMVVINLTFFVLNPFSFIFSMSIKNTTFASNFSNLMMMLLIFTLTFSTLFSVQMNFSLDDVQKFLIINPLFGYYDSMLALVGDTGKYFFGSYMRTIAYIFAFGLVMGFIERKLFQYK